MSEVKIDIEFLLNNPGTAVQCATEEEAQQFLSYMKKHYPDLCKNWDEDETRFNHYPDGVGYTFYWLDGNGDWRKDPLMYGGISSLHDEHYTVLSLWEIMDSKELEESDQSIDILFGGVA